MGLLQSEFFVFCSAWRARSVRPPGTPQLLASKGIGLLRHAHELPIGENHIMMRFFPAAGITLGLPASAAIRGGDPGDWWWDPRSCQTASCGVDVLPAGIASLVFGFRATVGHRR